MLKKLLCLFAILPSLAFSQVQPSVDSTPATLSNKTITSAANTLTIDCNVSTCENFPGGSVPASAAVLASNSSSQITAASTTGSGAAVLATSPTLVTPTLGAATASSLTDTGITGSTQCVHVNTSGLLSGTGSDCSSASSLAFSALTSGINISATMTLGTGSLLTVSGTGVNNANEVNGATVPASAVALSSNGSGQLTALANQSANTFFAGPSSGSAAAAAFRAMVAADLPTLIPLTNLATIASGNVLGNFSGIAATPSAQAAALLSSGTSGGVLAWTSSTTLASSVALTSGTPVCGGGAGATPLNCTLSGLATFGLAELAANNAFTGANTFTTASGATPTMQISNTGAAGNVNVFQGLGANVNGSGNVNFIWGQDASTNNAVSLNFNFTSSGSASNYAGLGLYGGTVGLEVVGSGLVTAPVGLVSTGASGIGYAAGAGGAVTQATSRTTGVTINKTTGAITLFTAAGSTTAATFTVTNSTVAATDTIVLSEKSGSNLYVLHVTAVAAGSFNITFFTTGGTTSDAPVINFTVVKGAAS